MPKKICKTCKRVEEIFYKEYCFDCYIYLKAGIHPITKKQFKKATEKKQTSLKVRVKTIKDFILDPYAATFALKGTILLVVLSLSFILISYLIQS